MKAEYIDANGDVVAWIENDELFQSNGKSLGKFDQNDEILLAERDPWGDNLKVVRFHEGLFSGPNENPFARLKNSEFSE